MKPCPFRAHAVVSGASTYNTGIACRNGHLANRITANGTCVECARIANAKSREKRKDRIKATNAAYYAANKEKVDALNKAWRDSNPERAKAVRLTHYHANKDCYRARSKGRKEDVKRATPAWVSFDDLAAVYAQAGALALETGIQHDVDHIVPLRGSGVCGLHVPWNLRPLPASINRAKRNSTDKKWI